MKRFKIIVVVLLIISITKIITNNNYNDYLAIRVVKSNNYITTDVAKLNKVLELKEYYKNSDIKGIISINNDNSFNYPIVQSNDNKYYLNHDYYKNYNKLGAIYADYRINLDTSKKILIYGHSSKKRDMYFNNLANYEDRDYYNNHKYLTLETSNNTYQYEIFSVYVETSNFTYMNINFNNLEDWYNHILELQEKSLHPSNITLTSNDDILILQTCSTNNKYINYSKKYLLVVARRVK